MQHTWIFELLSDMVFSVMRNRFCSLKAALEKRFLGAKVDNTSYPWKDHVILNGLQTAVDVVESKDDGKLPLILLGHSMGGLVCRVANLALTQTNSVQGAILSKTLFSTQDAHVKAKSLLLACIPAMSLD